MPVVHLYMPETGRELAVHYAQVHSRFYPDEELRRQNEDLRRKSAALGKRISALETELLERIKRVRELELELNAVPIQHRDVVKAVSQQWKVRSADLFGVGRYRQMTEPRQIGMALCYWAGLGSLNQIGKWWGRDHTTVLHAMQKYGPLFDELQLDRNADAPVWAKTCFEKLPGKAS